MIPVLVTPINPVTLDIITEVITDIITEEILTPHMIPIPYPKVSTLQIPILHLIDQTLPVLEGLIPLIIMALIMIIEIPVPSPKSPK